ncbi:phage integrase family protein [Paraburkholderia sp. UCT31]|uniref:tyrosine-type recombinase/integrase n=1 Tax=Paraburkholderia sp. UCT31 TaxID=2615209 RepID=UPI00165648AD|nr:tyrosine-type recombinase/integrase [Paraburkholderia sp. UCT31]MBC8737385.1 phage integrase family protein [Paraburkholderia sp. UCT31]
MDEKLLFERWCKEKERDFADSSRIVYAAMWGNFVQHYMARGKRLEHVDSAEIESFFNKQTWARNTAKRYFKLLDDILDHFAGTGMLKDNPAAALRRRFAYYEEARNPLILAPHQERALFDALPPPTHWKRVRDAALVGLLFGGGLKLQEAIFLEVSHLNVDGDYPHVRVFKNGFFDREVPIFGMAVAYVRQWLLERRRRAFASTLAFPANFSGTPLDRSTVYRQVKAVFERAGVEKEHKGAGLLRNSFGARQLRQGTSLDTVRKWMGHKLEESTEPLRRQVERQRRARPT